MSGIQDVIEKIDISVFDRISSQTGAGDRRSILKLQKLVRSKGDYAYLEIGSFMGGTLQSFYPDPLCKKIFSIDLRPGSVRDERGKSIKYERYSAGEMQSALMKAWPEVQHSKIVSFESDASDVDVGEINPPPQLCFIDGEHTNRAVVSDFEFVYEVCADDAVVFFHDANIVMDGIQQITSKLLRDGKRFESCVLEDNIFVIFLEQSADDLSSIVAEAIDHENYFRAARKRLKRQQLRSRYPAVFKVWDKLKGR